MAGESRPAPPRPSRAAREAARPRAARAAQQARRVDGVHGSRARRQPGTRRVSDTAQTRRAHPAGRADAGIGQQRQRDGATVAARVRVTELYIGRDQERSVERGWGLAPPSRRRACMHPRPLDLPREQLACVQVSPPSIQYARTARSSRAVRRVPRLATRRSCVRVLALAREQHGGRGGGGRGPSGGAARRLCARGDFLLSDSDDHPQKRHVLKRG